MSPKPSRILIVDDEPQIRRFLRTSLPPQGFDIVEAGNAAEALAAFARVAKAEHRIEECLQRSKSEAGLADYEVRNWTGWHHHQTLSLIATWFLVTETHRGKKMDPCDDIAPDPRGHRIDLAHRVSVRDDTAYAA